MQLASTPLEYLTTDVMYMFLLVVISRHGSLSLYFNNDWLIEDFFNQEAVSQMVEVSTGLCLQCLEKFWICYFVFHINWPRSVHSFYISYWNNYRQSINTEFSSCHLFLPRNALKCICAVLGSHVVRLSVRLSVCDVGELWSHTLEILETNCTDN